ncbi:MAG: oligosaccharide flippase family protein, partial [Leptolyngbya sp. SIO3F4]|nr:oligosaccharide flippase family protein [Leptolyngbya sp. SIO3F4]
MSLNKRIAFGVSISWLSRVVGIFAKLLLVPILFEHLGKEEVGAWFLLGDSQGLLTLLGFGIVPTLTRHVALIKGESGSDIDVELNSSSMEKISNLITTGKITLRVLALFVFIIAWVSGYLFLQNLVLTSVDSQQLLLAWTFMCLGYAINVWVSYLECWLLGMGYVGWNSLFSTLTNIVTVILSIGIVINGGGILALAIISVLVNSFHRLALVIFISKKYIPLDKLKGKWKLERFKEIIKPAALAWLTELGAFLIARTDSYFIAASQGIGNVAAYSATHQLFANLFLVSNSVALVSPVFISQFWRAGDLNSVHQLTCFTEQEISVGAQSTIDVSM